MTQITWLHISDWHQKVGKNFDRSVIARKLIDDIRNRTRIDRQLQDIDFIVFSGDIAFSGERDQFEQAYTQLIDPIRKIVGEDKPIYCVPGNHDIQRSAVAQIPKEMSETLAGEDNGKIEDLLQDNLVVQHINRPLKNFYEFATKLQCNYEALHLHIVQKFEKDGRKIGIACLNTAWLCARARIEPRPPALQQEFWDRGLLRMTEAQIRGALEELQGFDLSIAVMHHPLHWLEEVEQAKAELMIAKDCHIVLHGHEHRPNMNRLSNAFGDVVTIPAGASYNRRIASDPRYTNAYNYCSVDLNNNVGTVYHQVWREEADGWEPDQRFWANGRSLFFIQKKQQAKQQRLARTALDHLSMSYLNSIHLRPVIEQEIDLRHETTEIDGEKFILAKVRIKITFHAGDDETFPIRSQVNSRILSHPNPNVRAAAYRLVSEQSAAQWVDDSTRKGGYFKIGPDEETIKYEYEMLETLDGLYYFNLRRFTNKVKFTLYENPEFDYEDLPFGGFPAGSRSDDPNFSKGTIWQTKQLAMPNQGLLVQWYPKRKPAQAHAAAAE